MKQTKKQIKAQCMNELQGRFDRMNASMLAENKRLHQTVNELRLIDVDAPLVSKAGKVVSVCRYRPHASIVPQTHRRGNEHT